MSANVKQFIGKKLNTEVTVDQIKAATGAEEVRVLYPDSPMTMDLRHDRYNVLCEQDGTIVDINQG